ncbi:MAG: ABC transporter permease, partial [Anaerolineales bacterium]
MLFLATRNLQVRAARTTFTALAVALGVGMIFAMRIVTATLEETARAARLSRLSGANLEITNAIGANIPLTLLPTIEARPEVETAAPIYRALEGRPSGTATFSMSGLALRGTGLALLGVDPAHTLTPYEVTAGEFLPQTPNADAVLLPADWAVLHGLGPGDSLQLDTGDETATYTIVGLLKPERGLIASAPIAWLPLDTLADAFNTPATASSILVRLAPGLNPDDAQAALQAALGDQYIVYSAHSGEAATSIFNLLNLALPVAGFAVLLTGGFLVFNAFAITLAERRREIGQLRVLGMTRGQILAQTLLEAGLVGLMGSLVGLVLGWGLGRGVIAVMGVLNGVAAAEAIIPLDAAPLALGAGVLVTLAVTLGLALQASRLSPLLALKETESHSDSPPNRLVSAGLGFAFLIAIGASYWYAQAYIRNTHTPNYGLFFLPALFFGALIVSVLPLWLEGGLWLWRRLARGVTAQLAADTLIRQRSRAALTTATLVISFMLVIALTGVTLFMSSFIIGMNVSLFSGQIVLIRTMP